VDDAGVDAANVHRRDASSSAGDAFSTTMRGTKSGCTVACAGRGGRGEHRG
jgi:hypothetical protein